MKTLHFVKIILAIFFISSGSTIVCSAQQNADSASIYYNMGESSFRQSQFALSITYFLRSLNFYPTANTHLSLSYSYFKNNNIKSSLASVKTALSFSPSLKEPALSAAKKFKEYFKPQLTNNTDIEIAARLDNSRGPIPVLSIPKNNIPLPPFPASYKIYRFRQVLSNKVLAVSGSSTDTLALIDQVQYSGHRSQLWKFRPLRGGEAGYYLIHPALNTNLCLTDVSKQNVVGGGIGQRPCRSTKNQKWKLIKSNNFYLILSKSSQQVITFSYTGVISDPNGKIALYTNGNGINQQWIVEEE